MITETLLNEFSYAIQQAEILVKEMREARSLLSSTVDIKRLEATNKALLYFVMTDPVARNDIKKVALQFGDRDVLELVAEFEN